MKSFRRFSTARKEYKCELGGDKIEPGEQYVDVAIPPWTLVIDDPEGPYSPQGNWYHMRFHIRCQTEEMAYYG